MTDPTPPAVDAFLTALREPSEAARAALHAQLAEGVEVLAPFAVGTGSTAVDTLLDHPLVARVARRRDLVGAGT